MCYSFNSVRRQQNLCSLLLQFNSISDAIVSAMRNTREIKSHIIEVDVKYPLHCNWFIWGGGQIQGQ